MALRSIFGIHAAVETAAVQIYASILFQFTVHYTPQGNHKQSTAQHPSHEAQAHQEISGTIASNTKRENETTTARHLEYKKENSREHMWAN